MEVNGRCCDVDVAEQDLHHARLGALLKPDFNTFPVRRLLRSAQRIDLT
jgi:hypothetical protein